MHLCQGAQVYTLTLTLLLLEGKHGSFRYMLENTFKKMIGGLKMCISCDNMNSVSYRLNIHSSLLHLVADFSFGWLCPEVM